MIVELYERPETAWEHANRITPAYRQLLSSMLPPARLLHARLTSFAAAAAHKVACRRFRRDKLADDGSEKQAPWSLSRWFRIKTARRLARPVVSARLIFYQRLDIQET